MIINDLDGYYIVFDTKNWNTELDTLDKNILYSTASGIGFAFSTKLPKYEIKQGQEGFSCISLNKKDIFIENILLEVK